MASEGFKFYLRKVVIRKIKDNDFFVLWLVNVKKYLWQVLKTR